MVLVVVLALVLLLVVVSVLIHGSSSGPSSYSLGSSASLCSSHGCYSGSCPDGSGSSPNCGFVLRSAPLSWFENGFIFFLVQKYKVQNMNESAGDYISYSGIILFSSEV